MARVLVAERGIRERRAHDVAATEKRDHKNKYNERFPAILLPSRATYAQGEQGAREVGLILEDDNVVAPHFWRWLRAAHRAYGARRDVAGVTLQRLHFCQQIGCPDPPAYPAGGPTELMLNPVRRRLRCFSATSAFPSAASSVSLACVSRLRYSRP